VAVDSPSALADQEVVLDDPADEPAGEYVTTDLADDGADDLVDDEETPDGGNAPVADEDAADPAAGDDPLDADVDPLDAPDLRPRLLERKREWQEASHSRVMDYLDGKVERSRLSAHERRTADAYQARIAERVEALAQQRAQEASRPDQWALYEQFQAADTDPWQKGQLADQYPEHFVWFKQMQGWLAQNGLPPTVSAADLRRLEQQSQPAARTQPAPATASDPEELYERLRAAEGWTSLTPDERRQLLPDNFEDMDPAAAVKKMNRLYWRFENEAEARTEAAPKAPKPTAAQAARRVQGRTPPVARGGAPQTLTFNEARDQYLNDMSNPQKRDAYMAARKRMGIG